VRGSPDDLLLAGSSQHADSGLVAIEDGRFIDQKIGFRRVIEQNPEFLFGVEKLPARFLFLLLGDLAGSFCLGAFAGLSRKLLEYQEASARRKENRSSKRGGQIVQSTGRLRSWMREAKGVGKAQELDAAHRCDGEKHASRNNQESTGCTESQGAPNVCQLTRTERGSPSPHRSNWDLPKKLCAVVRHRRVMSGREPCKS